ASASCERQVIAASVFPPRYCNLERDQSRGRGDASVLVGGKLSPARHTMDTDGDDREIGEFHCAILRVPLAKKSLRAVVLGALRWVFARAAQQAPPEPRPVLVIAVGDKRRDRIFGDIAQALQCPRVSFGLLINRDVERAFADGKAHRHEMRYPPC